MPVLNDMDIIKTAFNELQYSYDFNNDASSVQRVPTMMNYNYNRMDTHSGINALSPMSASLSPQTDDSCSNMFALSDEHFITFADSTGIVMPSPKIVILDQPVDKFRFRYKSEMMGTHGSLSSASTTSRRKRQAPTVKLVGFVGERAKIRCTLVTSDSDRRMPHAHRLVKREGNDENDAPYEIEVSRSNDFTAQFQGMGIIHTAKKHIKDELVRKMSIEAIERNRCKNPNVSSLRVSEETQIKMDAETAQKWMNLNSVSLCFRAYLEDANGVMKPITDPAYSVPINNLKSALTGELKICRIDKISSSCEGGEEVFMLVEKVGKKNIKVKFFEVDENDHEVWTAYGRFSELDVHHQYAIVFKTPPYNREITAPKDVYIKLERPTDGDSSEPIKFTYKPRDHIFSKKRPRISYSGSADLTPFKQRENVNLTSNRSTDNSSQEFLKWLETCDKIPSEEYAKFINSLDIDSYIETIEPRANDQMLTTDSAMTRPMERRNDSMLAMDGEPTPVDERSFAEHLVHTTMKKVQDNPRRAKEYFTKMFDERTTYGDTALHSALRHGQLDIAKSILMMLASDPDLKILAYMRNSSGKTPLHYAVLFNHPKVVKALIVLGADPNECDDRDFYPLHHAVKNPEYTECVEALLTKKVKLEARDESGWTPLHLAVEVGSMKALKLLVEAGADVNETEVSYGRTALHIAVENGHTSIVKYLLEQTEIEVDKKNLGGYTALHTAAANPGELSREMCKILIDHGADPNVLNLNEDATEEEETKISIKEEIDSDETIEQEDQSDELSSNKPEISRLSENATHNADETIGIEIKEEIMDINDKAAKYLDNKVLEQLAKILDKNRSWEKLAKYFDCDYLLSAVDIKESSPSMTILNYADIQGILEADTLIDSLNKIGDRKAASFLEKIIREGSPS